jgi:hypothetical protein
VRGGCAGGGGGGCDRIQGCECDRERDTGLGGGVTGYRGVRATERAMRGWGVTDYRGMRATERGMRGWGCDRIQGCESDRERDEGVGV